MSSTKNKNQKYEYMCEKQLNKNVLSYQINNVFSEQKNPNQMFVLGSIPTKMNSSHFSKNSIDMESYLRGINSTNLENKSFQPTLQKKDFYTQELFKNNLKEDLKLPNSFYHNSNIRSGFHNI